MPFFQTTAPRVMPCPYKLATSSPISSFTLQPQNRQPCGRCRQRPLFAGRASPHHGQHDLETRSRRELTDEGDYGEANARPRFAAVCLGRFEASTRSSGFLADRRAVSAKDRTPATDLCPIPRLFIRIESGLFRRIDATSRIFDLATGSSSPKL